MVWNYRLVRHVTRGIVDETLGEWYAVHEAYYTDNATEPEAITEDPVSPAAETLKELAKSYVMLSEAFGKPALDAETFTYPPTRNGQSVLIRFR